MNAAPGGAVPTMCGRCGQPPVGLASIGDVPYCHGDWDPGPTCYEIATRERSAGATPELLATPSVHGVAGDVEWLRQQWEDACKEERRLSAEVERLQTELEGLTLEHSYRLSEAHAERDAADARGHDLSVTLEHAHEAIDSWKAAHQESVARATTAERALAVERDKVEAVLRVRGRMQRRWDRWPVSPRAYLDAMVELDAALGRGFRDDTTEGK